MSGEPAALLRIDMSACEGRGLCLELLAGRLIPDEWGYPLGVDAEGRGTTRVPLGEEDLDDARTAARLCPVRALKLQRRPAAGQRSGP